MTYHPSHIDFALAVTMIVLMAIEVRGFEDLSCAVKSGIADKSRLPAYIYLLVYQWGLVACTLALWAVKRRAWSLLLLGPPHPWAFWACLVITAAFVALMIVQRRAFLSRPELLETARRRLAQIEAVAPRTSRERRLWTGVAITAGCCEEVLFRGFLLALVANLVGLIASVVINALLFGLFHTYYGWRGMLRTGSFGLLMALIALWSGSLIPAILIHGTVDLASGDLAYRALSKSSLPG